MQESSGGRNSTVQEFKIHTGGGEIHTRLFVPASPRLLELQSSQHVRLTLFFIASGSAEEQSYLLAS